MWRSVCMALVVCGLTAACGDGGDSSNGGATATTGTSNATSVQDVDTGFDARPENPTCLAPERPPSGSSVQLVPVFEELPRFEGALWMTQRPGDGSRWYVVEQSGRVLSVENRADVTEARVVLDIRDRVVARQELGLLGMAFHPDFARNGEVFLSYTAPGPTRSVVARATSPDGGDTIDPDSITPLLELEQPYENHNGGHLLFGPRDGYLYFGMGDGGAANDPGNRAQDVSSLFGAMIRIDVDSGDPYGIPADNPFASGVGGLPEIYAWGLRNPWRFSFDRETGELWAGDVGQNAIEEVSLIELGGNYGWRIKEGTACFNPIPCDAEDDGLIDPIAEYGHDLGRSITGGYVYRGAAVPGLAGTYLYGDYVSGRIWGLFFDPMSGEAAPEVILESGLRIATFAEDVDGELYVLDYSSGRVYQLQPAGDPPEDRFPRLLSETGCVDPSDPTQPAPGLIPYAPTAPFWSDGAEKERWFALPDGATITVNDAGDWELPVGSVVVKGFLVGDRRVETRLMIRHDDGAWAGYSYAWNDAQTDAELLPAGKTLDLPDGGAWVVPSRSGCLQCHTAEAGRTLGLETAQLDSPLIYPGGRRANQLQTLTHIGVLSPEPPADPPALVDPFGDAPLELRARAYLHTNCSHCHRPGGVGQGTADLRFDTPLADMGVCDVPPLEGDQGVADARLLAPGAPERSMLVARMRGEPVRRMPPDNGVLIDEDGAALLEAWIGSLTGCP